MKADARLFAAAFLLVPALLFADPLSQRGLEETAKKGPEITDAMIDEKKKVLDRVLSKRSDEAGKEAAETVALEGKLKQERIDFEKKQIADRKNFLDNLKKETDQKKRTSLYRHFNTDQKNDRRRFFNTQNDLRDEVASKYRKARLTEHDDVVLAPLPVAAKAPAEARKPVAKAAPAAKKAPAKAAAKK